MFVFVVNEKEQNNFGEKGIVEVVEIEVEEIGFINNYFRNLIFLSIGIFFVSIVIGFF